jgi:hypothetical protein
LPILEEPFPGQQAAALFHVEHAIHNTVVTEKAFQLLRCCDVMIDPRQFPGVWWLFVLRLAGMRQHPV